MACTTNSLINLKDHYKGYLKGFFTLSLLLFSITAISQSGLDVLRAGNEPWLKYTDISNSLYRHVTGEVYDQLADREAGISGIRSLADWERRQQYIRNTLFEITGPFPEKTPLNPRITGTIEKDDFTVENFIFESQPGFYVTSSLFIPKQAGRGKAPAVIYCSGHTIDGYRSPAYQHKIINLVKKGFIVLAFDPVGQGERLEYFDPETGKSAVGGPTIEHSYPGAQAFITGSSQARYMIWDGIRAVDYLLTRKEVDPAKIGIAGRSGGGTQSALIAAFDDRIYAAAPEAYITNFTRLLQSIGPQDAEQNLYQGIKHGIDHADLLTVRAPRPALVIATTNDYFSIQGARETVKEVEGVYKSYGKPGNIGMAEDLEGHGSTRKNREAMYAFFQKHLDNPGNPEDMDVEILDKEELRVTATGQLSSSGGSETVFSLNAREADFLTGQLSENRKDIQSHAAGIIGQAREKSGYRAPQNIEMPVYTGRLAREGYRIEKYFIRGEGDYVIPYLLMIPDNPGPGTLIWLDPGGKSACSGPGGTVEWFVMQGYTVLVPDLVGTGETGPGIFTGDAYIEGVSYNVWFAAMLTGRSIAGIQASDVVRLTRLLREFYGRGDIYALAIKEMASTLLHAAAFDPSITRVALVEPLSSYRSLVRNRYYAPRFIHGAVPGMIRAYDLPDLAASLAPRALLITDPVDGTGKPDDSKGIENDLSVIRSAYKHRGSSHSLIIGTGGNIRDYLAKWIGQ